MKHNTKAETCPLVPPGHPWSAVQPKLTLINLSGFEVEETGGGCQWLRRGRLAITDGDAGLPKQGESCELITLDANGDYSDLIEPMTFPSLEACLAYVEAAGRIYSR